MHRSLNHIYRHLRSITRRYSLAYHRALYLYRTEPTEEERAAAWAEVERLRALGDSYRRQAMARSHA